MSGKLVAIDFLLELDESASRRAKEANALLRHDYAAGFPLDESHTPHVTLVQRYVEQDDLPAILTAVTQVVNSKIRRGPELEIVGYESWPRSDPEIETVVMSVNRDAALRDLQQAIIATVQPFAASGGATEAFAPNTDGSPINPNIVTYVERFLPDNAGDNYKPHVTVGFAHKKFAHEFCARPFARLKFRSPGVAIYQLGSFGTARVKLWP